jgi:hypothetical protein
LAPLRRSLSCVTDAQLLVSHSGGEVVALRLSRDPLPLRSTHVAGGLQLRLRHQYRFVEDPEAPVRSRWHVSTVAYDYRLSRHDSAELLSWHWHPQTGLSTPHLHAAVDHIGRRAHLPTGRVSVESVLRLLLADLGVPSTREDWQAVLDAAEGPFIRHRRWG